jgi:arsenite methyltransferase
MLYPLSYERRCLHSLRHRAEGLGGPLTSSPTRHPACRQDRHSLLRPDVRRQRLAPEHRRTGVGGPGGGDAGLIALSPYIKLRGHNGGVTENTDRWHRWLMDTRFGGDAVHREKELAKFLYPVRDAVLDGAQLAPGETVLDVGTGDGLIGFGALDRVGPGGRVIFSDISRDLLDHCRKVAATEHVLDRCSFVLASADHLDGIPDAHVDVVTTRSVLIYVKDKLTAFKEFYRVLRPEGRISLFEPINVLMSCAEPALFWGYDVAPVQDLADKVTAVYAAIQPAGQDPMLDFDDRDLVRLARQAGFPDVKLDLEVAVRTGREPTPWDRFMRSSGNPLIPTFEEALRQALTAREATRLVDHLRPLVEAGKAVDRKALAYLTAVKS